jgi:hypothetical protein
MKCEEIHERLIDAWESNLTSAEKAELDGHLAACAECEAEARALGALWSQLGELPDVEPGPGLRARFDVMLEAYRAGQRRTSLSLLERIDGWLAPLVPRRPAFQLAAALGFLAVGAFIGARLAEEAPPTPGESPDQISVLSAEVRELRTLVAVSLLQQSSPSERLRGVSFSHQVNEPEPNVLAALVSTLNHDPNVNVRLAAIDALTRFADRDSVRDSLVRSLPSQDSPLVQISLIDLMVRLREKDAVDMLRALAEKSDLHPAVRERARWGLEQIRG